MADISVSYSSSDRDWAHWIARELQALGHVAHVHEWEIEGGDDIHAWMDKHLDAADRVLCVVSDDYLKAPYSTLERNAALWQAAGKRAGFVLIVAVNARLGFCRRRPGRGRCSAAHVRADRPRDDGGRTLWLDHDRRYPPAPPGARGCVGAPRAWGARPDTARARRSIIWRVRGRFMSVQLWWARRCWAPSIRMLPQGSAILGACCTRAVKQTMPILRAIAVGVKVLGASHPLTQRSKSHHARLLLDTGQPAEALALAQTALAAHEANSGATHPWTKDSATTVADALAAFGRTDEAAAVRARYGLKHDSASS